MLPGRVNGTIEKLISEGQGVHMAKEMRISSTPFGKGGMKS